MTRAAGKKDFGKYETPILRVSETNSFQTETDSLAVEEPLEIRIGSGKEHRAVSITMRTPGNDFELAAGFLFTEGILQSANQIAAIKHCGKFPNNQNTVRVDLNADTEVDFKRLERNFYTTSSCGVCGKTSLEAVTVAGAKKIENLDFPKVSTETIHSLPGKLRQAQNIFAETGGLHAAALFDSNGELLQIREDVGRHNALDKLIGSYFLDGKLLLNDTILFLSGRASFELIQKSAMTQIPVICAVGAPSSLAVEAAREFRLTLLGFVRENRFNVYTGKERLSGIV